MFHRSLQPLPVARCRGIALLVTIVLLVFLVLLMVAMSSLVRVETQLATNTESLAKARQNALFGLNLAIGKIQETAGPDLRVTARSDLGGPPGAPQSYLTGVWDTSGGAPALLTWLVNGNEDHFAGAPNVTPATVPNPVALALYPVGAALADDVIPPATPVAAVPRFGDGHVYLVGDGSVDTAGGAGRKSADEERVILRKSPIEVDGAKIPGRAAGVRTVVGHYAYWVGDDGVKASIGTGNQLGQLVPSPLDLAYDDSGGAAAGADYSSTPPAISAASDAAYINRKMLNGLQLQGVRADLLYRSTNIPGLDLLNGDEAFYVALAHPQAKTTLLSRLFSVSQVDAIRNLSYAAPAPAVGLSTFPNQAEIGIRLKQRYHDVSPKSRAVIGDMRSGGLRSDLSADSTLLNNSLGNGVQDFLDIWRPAGGGVAPVNPGTPDGLLQLTAPITTIPLPAADQAIFPRGLVMTEFYFTINFDIDSTNALLANFRSALELWNPYNVTLTLPQNLYVTIPTRVNGTDLLADVIVELIDTVSGVTGPKVVNVFNTIDTISSGIGIDNAVLIFQLASKDTINPTVWAPGQVKHWEFAGVATRPAKDGAGNPIENVQLAGSEFPVRVTAATELSVRLHMGTAVILDDVPALPILYEARNLVIDPAPDLTPTAGIGYYFRMQDQTDYNDPVAWLDVFDPRGPVLTQSAGTETIFQVGRILDSFAPNFDSSAVSLLINDVSAGVNPPNRIALFDMPRQEVLSIGSLQHLAFSPSAGAAAASAYLIGSPNPGAYAAPGNPSLNDVFDTHFFSSVPRDPATTWRPQAADVLANTGIRVFDPAPSGATPPPALLTQLQSAQSATALLIEDAFNINSTSQMAWVALLGGALPTLADPAIDPDYNWNVPNEQLEANWRYIDSPPFNAATVATQSLSNVFFSFSSHGA